MFKKQDIDLIVKALEQYRPTISEAPIFYDLMSELTKQRNKYLEKRYVRKDLVYDYLYICTAVKQKVRLEYTDEKGQTTVREVNPLALEDSPSGGLMLKAFCFMRDAYRTFKVESIDALTVLV